MASLARQKKISLDTGYYAPLPGESGPRLDAYVIPAGRTKHGPRRWGKNEYAQRCIVELIPSKLLKSITLKRVCNIVIPHSAKDPNFKLLTGRKELTESTVKRALQIVRRTNRWIFSIDPN
jgi:hypothetical protein